MTESTQSAQSTQARGVKRPNTYYRGPDLGKRRAPYALQACEACRRRKGKCDGRQPCGHCASRKQECLFTGAGAMPLVELGDASVPDVQAVSFDRETSSAASDGGISFLELVSNLQDQINNLASHVRLPNAGPGALMMPPAADLGGLCAQSLQARSVGSRIRSKTVGEVAQVTIQGFYGPTSPDYSLNVAQMRMRHGSFSSASPECQQLAAIDDEAVSDDEDDVATLSSTWRMRNSSHQFELLQFRNLLTLQNTIGLLFVYQEVVGDFHPFIDLDHLMSRASLWYAGSDSRRLPRPSERITEENDLLICNLVLAIALRAESTFVSSDMERSMQANFQAALNAKLAFPASGIKDVAVVLLAGIYHFFQDLPRCAWRMCGVAGRMLMELGFHNGDVSKHMLQSESQRVEAAVIMCSIVVLDRQWSAATGLPSNFTDSPFEPLPKALIRTPYLKAMLAFILISDKFSEPISHAAKGKCYEAFDTFELLNFQIEQWRKKAIGRLCVSQPEMWGTDPSSRPPSWAILLNLRAESIRSLLMRPCFFSNSDEEQGNEQLYPAMELVSNVVHVLFMLDTNTDIYRKQHPYYQHLLASGLALFFLMIAYVEGNPSLLSDNLPPGFSNIISSIFHMALTLTSKYTKTSRASRRLWKRLSEMRQTLNDLGLLSGNASVENQPLSKVNTIQPPVLDPTPHPNASKTTQSRAGSALLNWKNPFSPTARGECTRAPSNDSIPPIWEPAFHSTPNNDLQSGWAESLLFDWPVGDDNIFGVGLNS